MNNVTKGLREYVNGYGYLYNAPEVQRERLDAIADRIDREAIPKSELLEWIQQRIALISLTTHERCSNKGVNTGRLMEARDIYDYIKQYGG